MAHNFDINVPIKEELKKGLIFGIHARPPLGVINGYVGYHHEVISLSQTLSHSTRAFISNAECLPGFLVKDALNILV